MNGSLILVTGGTGFVGRAVVARLKEKGHTVRVLARAEKSVNPKDPVYRGVELVRGDVTEPDTLPAALIGVQAVIHLVGIIQEQGRNTFQSAHVDGTRNIVQAAEKAGVSRFIHMSALGTRAVSRSRYHQTKWQAEEIVRASSLAWTILQPGLIFGRGDAVVSRFASLLQPLIKPLALLPLPVFGDEKTALQPISVKDVAHVFVRALTCQESIHQSYELCGRESLSLPQIVAEISRALGGQPTLITTTPDLHLFLIPHALFFRSKPILVTLPIPFAYGAAFCFEKLCALLSPVLPASLCTPPLTVDQVIMLEDGNTGNGSRAESIFEFTPGSFQEGIREYLRLT